MTLFVASNSRIFVETEGGWRPARSYRARWEIAPGGAETRTIDLVVEGGVAAAFSGGSARLANLAALDPVFWPQGFGRAIAKRIEPTRAGNCEIQAEFTLSERMTGRQAAAFLEAIECADPGASQFLGGDPLIFADWLEERGELKAAERIRRAQ